LTIDSTLALDISVRLTACASMVASLEMVAVRREFQASGAFNVDGVETLYGRSSTGLRRLGVHMTTLLGVVALSSAGIIVLGPYSAPGRLMIVACLVGRTLVRWRRLLGGDGAEQITTLSLAATALAVLPQPSPARIDLAVAFIAAQLALSYVTAGIAKLVSPTWRSGLALPAIMSTDVHGHPAMARALRRWPAAAGAFAWTVILFECGFPFFMLGPPVAAIGTLGLGLAFHVACSVTMGLNNFLIAFPATYPCAFVAAAWLSPYS
jgi:hypothetical protein